MQNKNNGFFTRLRNIAAALTLLAFCLSFLAACAGAGASESKEKKKPRPKFDQILEEDEAEEKTDEAGDKAASQADDKATDKKKAADTGADAHDEDLSLADEIRFALNTNGEKSKDLVYKKADKNAPDADSLRPARKNNEQAKNAQEKKAASKSEDKSGKSRTPAAEDVWAELMRGNKRFRSGTASTFNFSAARRQLVAAQRPQAIVLGCADSRVPPELVFDKSLGELFVVRNAGNVADEVALGSIEYAVEHLESKVLVVLGHENCSAVMAAVSGVRSSTRHLRAIIENITHAFEDSDSCAVGGKFSVSCVELNVSQSAADILMKSSLINKAVKNGDFTIIRAVYRMETGEVVRLKE